MQLISQGQRIYVVYLYYEETHHAQVNFLRTGVTKRVSIMFVFAVDIGNSTIAAGLYSPQEGWTNMEKIPTKTSSTASLEELFSRWTPEERKSVHCISLSTVAPHVTSVVERALNSCFDCPILIVTTKLQSPLQKPILETMGTDLFANAVSAYNKTKGHASITVDFGTALSFTAVSGDGKIAGVSLGLGITSSLEALVGNAALLNTFSLEYPKSALGTTDETALQSGVVLGNYHLIRGLCLQIQEELNEKCMLYATGGNSVLYAKSKLFTQIDPFHTLDGLRILAEHNHQNIS